MASKDEGPKKSALSNKKIPLGPTKTNVQYGKPFSSKTFSKKYTAADIEAHYNDSVTKKKEIERSDGKPSIRFGKEKEHEGADLKRNPRASSMNSFASSKTLRQPSLGSRSDDYGHVSKFQPSSRHNSGSRNDIEDSDTSFVQDDTKYIEPRFVYDVNCVVFVGNVSPNTTQDMLSAFFNQFGLVKSVNLKNSLTGRNRKDYAFIKFLVPESVQKVLNHKGPLELDGVVLEVRPRAGYPTAQTDAPFPQSTAKQSYEASEETDTFRTILVENIPQQWSPQFFFQCFTAYGKPTGCFMYDDVDEHNTKKGLIEMSNSKTAVSLCQNTGFLLLPNSITVKLTLTSITDFNDWIKKHSEWMSYQQMWSNYRVPMVPNMLPMPPSVSFHPNMEMGAPVESKQAPKKQAVVKVSNVDIKAFKNSDEIFKKLEGVFGPIETSAIASINSNGCAVVIFKVPNAEEAQEVNKNFDWHTFPGTVPTVEFP